MKRYGNLYGAIIAPENIHVAYIKAKKGKASFRSVRKVEREADVYLHRLHCMLRDKTFATSSYTEREIYEPKKRTIYVLPFYPDRIVQHALMNVIAPIWERLFIQDSYACIEGRGIHSGSRRTMEFVRRNRYCLKCDISKFYPSVDHEVLQQVIRRKIKCKDTLWLLDDIIKSVPNGKNVPIGNYTSQWMGNLYMNELDMYVKHKLKIRDYIRYCDDFLLFHNDKQVLNAAARSVRSFCAEQLKLSLSKCDLFPVARGVDFLGYRHFPEYILLRKRTAKRVFKRLRNLPDRVAAGKVEAHTARAQISSAWGWMRFANTHNMRKKLELDALKESVDALCAVQ